MTLALALVPDLLFGSRLLAAAQQAGVELELLGDEQSLRARLAAGDRDSAGMLVVDLTDAALDGPALVASLRAGGELAGVHVLGFYAHVDTDVRERAEQAGFDLVVPRSRMAREAAALLSRPAD